MEGSESWHELVHTAVERGSSYPVDKTGDREQAKPLLQEFLTAKSQEMDFDKSDEDNNGAQILNDKESIGLSEYKTIKHSNLEFEEALQLLKMGRYQIQQYTLLVLVGVVGAMHMLAAVFICAAPKHRCYVPVLDANHSYTDLSSVDYNHNNIIPYDHSTQQYSSCQVYSDINITEPTSWEALKPSPIIPTVTQHNRTRVAKNCKEYLYDKSMYGVTIVTEWQLVCDSAYIRSLSESMLMAGFLVGGFVFGITSDKYGRKFTLCFSIVIQFTFGILSALMPNVEAFTMCRFVLGMAMSGVFLTAFVMGNEMVLPHMRTYLGVFFHFPGQFGALALGALAYYIRQWRLLEVVITLCGAYMLFYYWLVDDSVRWLIANGKHDKAEVIFRKAARINKVRLPEQFSLKAHKCETDEASIVDLVRTPNLRKNALIIFYSWFVSSLVFYAIQLNIEGLPGNDYVNFFISILVDIPVTFICLYFMSRLGRRPTQLTGMLCAAFSCTMLGFIPKDYHGIIVTLAMIGKLCISVSFTTSYQYSVEAFPTVTRNAGIGASSMCARVGGIVAPFIILMENSYRWLPYALLGSAAFVGSFLTYFLPETKGKHLPETLGEGEQFGLDESRFLSHLFSKKHTKPISSNTQLINRQVFHQISTKELFVSSSSSPAATSDDEDALYVKSNRLKSGRVKASQEV